MDRYLALLKGHFMSLLKQTLTLDSAPIVLDISPIVLDSFPIVFFLKQSLLKIYRLLNILVAELFYYWFQKNLFFFILVPKKPCYFFYWFQKTCYFFTGSKKLAKITLAFLITLTATYKYIN